MSRVRGFASWTPRHRTLALLEQVQDVLNEYANYLPLTLRQIFYRLVGAHDYAKTEQAYARLGETLNRARRAGIVSFAAIRDDGLTALAPVTFAGPGDFWDNVGALADGYRRDRLERQDVALELWVEAAGMAPQLANALKEYGVPVFSSGGFDSLTVKYEAAQRIAARDRPTIVLHIGDFDPSGLSLFEAAAEDVAELAGPLGAWPLPVFERIAVTPEQIAQYDLPGSPPKRTDRRGVWREGDETVQVEALPPDVLAAEVRQAVEGHVDDALLAAVYAAEILERRELLNAVEQVGGSA